MTSKFSIDNRELLQRISSGDAVVGIDFGNLIVRELAAFRLAAMDSEQLAIENFRSAMEGIGHIRRTLEETFGGLHGTHVEPAVLAECKAICDAIYAAYRHAQPAQTGVDDDVRNIIGLLETNEWAEHCTETVLGSRLEAEITRLVGSAQPAPVVPDDVSIFEAAIEECKTCDSIDEHAWNHGVLAVIAKYESCRAAILAAAPQSPGSEPATVPGKWIPVSERMPEDRTQVILWDAEIGEVTSGHYSHKTHTFYHCGDAIENEITHWMPPPCAPQEVNRE